MERKRQPIGRFFPLMELQLERSWWRVELVPSVSDIYWNHLGLSKLSLRLCRVAVNTCLLLMLLFCSSPLAVISDMKSAARIINTEAMDNAQLWLAWLKESSWLGTVFLQFMSNVLIFVSMYIITTSVLSYLSKFEKHLTMSEEQCAALLAMVCFFLVNLILLRALVESSLESTILHTGLFGPLVVPVGAFYIGYRYIADKYNFLFVYRHRGFPAGNDGKLID